MASSIVVSRVFVSFFNPYIAHSFCSSDKEYLSKLGSSFNLNMSNGMDELEEEEEEELEEEETEEEEKEEEKEGMGICGAAVGEDDEEEEEEGGKEDEEEEEEEEKEDDEEEDEEEEDGKTLEVVEWNEVRFAFPFPFITSPTIRSAALSSWAPYWYFL